MERTKEKDSGRWQHKNLLASNTHNIIQGFMWPASSWLYKWSNNVHTSDCATMTNVGKSGIRLLAPVFSRDSSKGT